MLLYSSDLIASIVPDNKRLRDFVKVELKPGEVKTVTFTVPATKLAFVNDDGKWTIEEGDFNFKVGRLQQTARCTSTKIWDTPNID